MLNFFYLILSCLSNPIFSYNFYDISRLENNPADQKCGCYSNLDGSNKFFINNTEEYNVVHISLTNASNKSPEESNTSCSNTPFFNCSWIINVEYEDVFDRTEIVLDTNVQELPYCDYTLVISDCYEIIWFNYSYFNDTSGNEIINMTVSSNEICIYFNSSGKNIHDNFPNNNYCSFKAISLYYKNAPDCECPPPKENYLNSINNSLEIPTEVPSSCKNANCLNCEWHINIDYNDIELQNQILIIEYYQFIYHQKANITMTNCNNNVLIIDSSSSINDGVANLIFVRERELCLKLISTNKENKCNYHPTSFIFYFSLYLGFIHHDEVILNLKVK